MSVHFGPSFYTEIDKIINSYDDRLNYDAKFCEKKKIIKFIFYLDELEQDKIIEIQQKCVKIFIDENEKNPSIFKLTIEREFVCFTCKNEEYFEKWAEVKRRLEHLNIFTN